MCSRSHGCQRDIESETHRDIETETVRDIEAMRVLPHCTELDMKSDQRRSTESRAHRQSTEAEHRGRAQRAEHRDSDVK
jgi:hypothetical protein